MYRLTWLFPALAGLLFFGAALAAACGGDDGGGGATPGGASSTQPPDPGSGSSVELTIDNRTFSPRRFTLKAGAAATINIKNNDGEAHNLTIQNGPASGTIQGGTSGTLKFTPERGGLNFLCTIHGTAMSGTIVVE